MKIAINAVNPAHPSLPRRALLVAAATLALGACSGMSTVSIDVSSQGDWPGGAKPGSYAIERLPSQQANAAEQARIEAAALPALAMAGFTSAPAEQADVLVQVGARTFDVVRPSAYGSPFYWRNDWWFHGRRPGFYGPSFGSPGFYRPGFYGYGYSGFDDVDVQREVAVLIRDRRSQKIVYETRAVYLQRWNSEALLAAMFEAALKDFPRAAISPRTVVVNLPRG